MLVHVRWVGPPAAAALAMTSVPSLYRNELPAAVANATKRICIMIYSVCNRDNRQLYSAPSVGAVPQTPSIVMAACKHRALPTTFARPPSIIFKTKTTHSRPFAHAVSSYRYDINAEQYCTDLMVPWRTSLYVVAPKRFQLEEGAATIEGIEYRGMTYLNLSSSIMTRKLLKF